MSINIKSSVIQFRNPQIGQPTRAVVEHYYGRRVIANIDGTDQTYKFVPSELHFEATEEEIIMAINLKIN